MHGPVFQCGNLHLLCSVEGGFPIIKMVVFLESMDTQSPVFLLNALQTEQL